MAESLCCTYETNTLLYNKSIILPFCKKGNQTLCILKNLPGTNLSLYLMRAVRDIGYEDAAVHDSQKYATPIHTS